MKSPAVRSILVLCAAGALAVACGRSELDFGETDDLPVSTGNAGVTGAAGSVGAAGVSGAAGVVGTAGTNGHAGSTGAAGHPMTGAAGATTGAAGVVGTAGTNGRAGSTGAAGRPMTGAAGMSMPPPPPPPPPMPVPCGGATCTPGKETCCFRPGAGAACLPVGEMCGGGASVGCLDTPSCGPGAVCCVSLQALGTTCAQPAQCLTSAGLILCSTDMDCPGALSHCCGGGGFRVCRAMACGGGGMGGPGPGGGRGGRGGRGGPAGGGAPPPGN
jgi:hypothetical protein